MKRIKTVLSFESLFYILDRGLCRVLFVEKEDKYEYFGLWVRQKPDDFHEVYEASINKQCVQEYITNYDFTKDKNTVISFMNETANKKPLTTEQMQNQNSNPDFHY